VRLLLLSQRLAAKTDVTAWIPRSARDSIISAAPRPPGVVVVILSPAIRRNSLGACVRRIEPPMNFGRQQLQRNWLRRRRQVAAAAKSIEMRCIAHPDRHTHCRRPWPHGSPEQPNSLHCTPRQTHTPRRPRLAGAGKFVALHTPAHTGFARKKLDGPELSCRLANCVTDFSKVRP
jgi:hypothetical protein